MVDVQDIKNNPGKYIDACKNKNVQLDIQEFLTLADKRKQILDKLQAVRTDINSHVEEIKKTGKPSAQQIEKGKGLKLQSKQLEEELAPIDSRFSEILYKIPNPPSADTPIGPDDSANVVVKKWGEPRAFEFTPVEHWQLGQDLDVIDTERASKVSGSRFVYLKGDLVRLQFAIVQLTMAKLTDRSFVAEVIKENGLNLKDTPFTLVVPPVLINPEPFTRMARIEPREERYYIPSDNQFLVGSAEHTLGAMHMDELLPEEQLPIRYLGYSTSFRREAGSYGKDTKGILRMHQFDKLEMEVFSTAETSIDEQNLLVGIQEKLMQVLNIPYQVVICCTGDQGDPDARHLDVEAWLPGQNRYRETHSADLMTDYQSRRLNTRVKRNDRNELVHMNDATAFAIGRTLIAIMENYQQADGSIAVPEALKSYAGIETISRK